MPDGPPWLEGMRKAMLIRESVASVALTHEPGCECRICRAASGDEKALATILEWMLDQEGR